MMEKNVTALLKQQNRRKKHDQSVCDQHIMLLKLGRSDGLTKHLQSIRPLCLRHFLISVPSGARQTN